MRLILWSMGSKKDRGPWDMERSLKSKYSLAKYRYHAACNELWKHKEILKRLRETQPDASLPAAKHQQPCITENDQHAVNLQGELKSKYHTLKTLLREKKCIEMERRALEAGNFDMEDELESYRIRETGIRRARSMPDVSAIPIVSRKTNSCKQTEQLPSMMVTLKLKMNVMVLKKKAQQLSLIHI